MAKRKAKPKPAPKPSPGGAPLTLTDAVIARAAELLPKLMYLESLAPQLGVSTSTLYKWQARGAKEQKRLDKGGEPHPAETPYLRFLQAIKKGLSDGELQDQEAITAARAESWQAAAWRLERRFPERWGKDTDLIKQVLKEQRELRHELDRLKAGPGAAPPEGAGGGAGGPPA